ncbi:hypothetical protein M595_5391 [Lyngbya aestuarii BL J]|uniref:Uncharacterized protein n=1 Tax=Lyngbya aestuarii BL J TaxID=1348334 RepID=U7QA27_9CYAN|nr:hypothetical protein M595_5391 [Lyngbya aestuarii BL J]
MGLLGEEAKKGYKRFHSRLRGSLCMLLTEWCKNRGEVGIIGLLFSKKIIEIGF